MGIRSSVRLFSDYRTLHAWFEGLDVTLHQACDAYVASGQPVSVDNLTAALRGEFRLFQVSLDYPRDVTVDVPPTSYVADRETHTRYLAALRVSWSGSNLLLRTAPEPGYHFPYKGRIGKHTVKLLQLLPDHDPTAFVAEAVEHLDRLREALHRSLPTVRAYNDRIDAAIARKVRTY